MDSRKTLTDVNLIQKKSASCCQEARSDVPASFFFSDLFPEVLQLQKSKRMLWYWASTAEVHIHFFQCCLFCASAEIASWFKNILLCVFSVLQVIRT